MINTVLNYAYFALVIENAYVDFGDFESPIGTFFDDRNIFKLDPTFTKDINIYLRQNELDAQDAFFQFSSPEKDSFWSVDRREQDFSGFNGYNYITVDIQLDPQKDSYSRTVYSFFDLTGQVGGVFEILTLSFGLMVGFITKRIFIFNLLEALYYTKSGSRKVVPRSSFLFTDPEPEPVEEVKSAKFDTSYVAHNEVSNFSMFQERDRAKSELPSKKDENLDNLKLEMATWRRYKSTCCEKLLAFVSPSVLKSCCKKLHDK